MENSKKLQFEASLKTLETENVFDRAFYRPIGYYIAVYLTKTSITPNAVTIISIFFGVGAGFFFYFNSLLFNLIGVGLLIIANILDCVDGQLARLTGIKSQVGRILDGVAGDLWFISIYSFLALRLSASFGSPAAWTLAALAGASNMLQSNIVDYYKTLHLYFISLKKGTEFEYIHNIRQKYENMPKGINKLLFRLYLYYSILQTVITSNLQQLLVKLDTIYGMDYPKEVRTHLRTKSLELMPLINMMTFNWRSIVLFASIFVGQVWLYFFYEILVLNLILFRAISEHESFCQEYCLKFCD
jgi:phosphatidylglycerophosphate synthase